MRLRLGGCLVDTAPELQCNNRYIQINTDEISGVKWRSLDDSTRRHASAQLGGRRPSRSLARRLIFLSTHRAAFLALPLPLSAALKAELECRLGGAEGALLEFA